MGLLIGIITFVRKGLCADIVSIKICVIRIFRFLRSQSIIKLYLTKLSKI